MQIPCSKNFSHYYPSRPVSFYIYTFLNLHSRAYSHISFWLYTLLWQILLFCGLYSRHVSFTVVVWHILSLCGLYCRSVAYTNNKYHAQRTYHIFTPAGLCRSTHTLFQYPLWSKQSHKLRIICAQGTIIHNISSPYARYLIDSPWWGEMCVARGRNLL